MTEVFTRSQVREMMLEWRDIEEGDECPNCGGAGKYAYANTATWHKNVGIAGQAITTDVCDRCWGSGSQSQPWPSWRER